MSENLVSAAINDLLTKYDGIGWNLRQLVRSGLSADIVCRALSDVDLYPHADVVDLFGAMNGVDFSLNNSLPAFFIHPNYYPMSLDDCVDWYKISIEHDTSWRSGLFPLFGDQGGLYIAMDLNHEAGKAEIFHYSSGEGISFYSESLLALFDLISDAIEADVIYVDHEDGIAFLEMDDEEFEEMQMRKSSSGQ